VAPGDVVVGSLTLHPCKVLKHTLCGSLLRPWDPTGAIPGNVRVGFALLRARDHSRPAKGTLLPREGGPGYSTTGSATYYRQMYGRMLDRRNMLLVDQRGTGRSQPIDCPGLQNPTGPFDYPVAAGHCATSLGDKANLYGTALSADDVAAVIEALELGKVDLYGDSYGTFFAAVFAGDTPRCSAASCWTRPTRRPVRPRGTRPRARRCCDRSTSPAGARRSARPRVRRRARC
jgi:pimeloyl-ACP methyl ester carboxylesterase